MQGSKSRMVLKKMSLKKRLFRSIMAILLLALLILVLVVAAAASLLEETILDSLGSVENAELDSEVSAVVKMMESLDTAQDTENFSLTEQNLKEAGYELLLIDGEDIVYGGGTREKEFLQDFRAQDHRSEVPEVFYLENTTAVGRWLEDSGMYAMAVHFAEQEWWKGTFFGAFSSFFFICLVAGMAAICVLLVLSGIFAGRLSKRVMEPLEALAEGAERIRRGNLKEDIVYHGEEEFEDVCRTFNDMQRAILKSREQRLKEEKARSDMVTGISHDLRTPLTSARGYIQGILDGVAGTEEKKELYLRTAYEATEEMDILLQKLFDFSRLESGQLPFYMVHGDLAEFTAAWVAQREPALDERKVRISLTKGAEVLPEIDMDIEQLPRVFDNLLENSMKYAGTMPVRIDVDIREEGDHVLLQWSDNGKGVPEEKLDDIFQRFYRCDESRTEKGSGVGLYVVKYIVERHGGTITAQNAGGLLLRLCFPKGSQQE